MRLLSTAPLSTDHYKDGMSLMLLCCNYISIMTALYTALKRGCASEATTGGQNLMIDIRPGREKNK